jgi:hypothetical protein
VLSAGEPESRENQRASPRGENLNLVGETIRVDP